MSTEGAEGDDAETMASTGNADASFQQIASGSATGLGLDRDEKIGTGGLAAGEDSDDVEAGDWWRMNLRDGAEVEADREIPASQERMPGEESKED